MTKVIEGLGQIAPHYDLLLCDIWGVVHDGLAAFGPACEALAHYRRSYGPVILISNSPRPGDGVIAQLDGLGVPREAWSRVVTSGDVTRVLLRERAPGPAWRIGPERDDPLYEGLGLQFSSLEGARFIACSGPDDDEVETPEDYRERLIAARARELDMICANPDIVVQRGERLLYCGGALARLYEELGGNAIMAGKPHGPIYDIALASGEAALGQAVSRNRVLAIGDGLATDIAGASSQGLHTLFIARGIHAEHALGEDGRISAEGLVRTMSGAPAKADFALADLVW
jgi:HAD superfamily hydrolase (TIGR01459 family)